MNALATTLESLNPFALLLIAIACEVTGTTALRLSNGFTQIVPAAWVVVSYAISFYLFSLILKHIPMGIAYVIWGGLGGVGVVLIGALVWRDQLGPGQLAGMLLVVAGSVMLNVLTPTPAP